MLSRRVLLGSAVAAPFVVRSGLLMPVSTRLVAPRRYPNGIHWTFWRPQPFYMFAGEAPVTMDVMLEMLRKHKADYWVAA